MGRVGCVIREEESTDESRTTVTYIWVVLQVHIWGWGLAW